MTTNRATSPILPAEGRVKLDVHNLKALRQRRGGREILSEQFQERRLCLTRAAINRAESGKPVPYRTVRHLAAFYGIGVETLIETAPTRHAPPPRFAPDPAEVERLQCRAVIDGVHLARQGRIVDVQGVAGAGKSRLLAFGAADARARGYACVVLGGAGGTAGHTAARLMLALLGLDGAGAGDDAPLADRVRARCAALALPAVHVDACASLVAPAPDWPLPATQLLQTAALCALIQHRARHQPLLVCIDDLQCADWQLCMILNVAVPATLDYPVLWMFATRLEPGPARRPLGVRMDALARTTLHLCPPTARADRADAGGVHRLGRVGG
jgi:transcriptional regulator with XRE-family HTH domain